MFFVFHLVTGNRGSTSTGPPADGNDFESEFNKWKKRGHSSSLRVQFSWTALLNVPKCATRGFMAIAAAVFLPLATYSINYVDQAWPMCPLGTPLASASWRPVCL